MKVLCIGDPHLKITRLDQSREFLKWLDGVIVDLNPDLIINLGDTFDSHAVIRAEVLSEFMDHVYRSLETAPYIYLVGNHDMFKPNDSKYYALKHLKNKINNFIIIDEPTEYKNMTFVPYTHNPDNFPTKTSKICIAHQTFKGADFGNITTKDGVDADAVAAEIIISGHIHKKQVLGKVIYPGSPFSQSVNDINQVKGVMLFDTNTYAQKLIECPLPMWKGLRYEISPSFNCDNLHEELSESINDQDHWVIEITGPKAEIIGYIGSKRANELFNGKDIKIRTEFTDREKKLTTIKAISIGTIVDEYIDKIYSGALSKDELKLKSIDLLGKVRTK